MALLLKHRRDVPTDFKKKFKDFEDSFLNETVESVARENEAYFKQKAKEYYNNTDKGEEKELLRL